ncbi:tyrosine-protein phosphatase [Sphingomonas crocodyli]|uniref:Tyrosine-protein phosphatase n=1 Tax=Sphingomonas crocodyli TaxID=1979270 RepID=A0A437M0F4_9SPHN|nr:tyrosine-protein phosphatase [Sphingomonas crocodyli]RVT91083.1 tyrosine-protein phosphatase [Sphingomonas crocodyli]
MAIDIARRGALIGLGLLALAGAPAVAAGPAPVAAEAAAKERLLPLEGGQNFRDLGGYRTADGRTVKWGVLYRSGVMNGLTAKDFSYLSSRHLRTVVDLRSTSERTREPVAWPKENATVVLTRDYAMDNGALGALLAKPGINAADVRANMATGYRSIPNEFAPQFRMLVNELLADQAPLAFNCSAGKDRTGVGAAILLSILGVPRETVIQDYLLSNQYFRPKAPASDDPAMAAFRNLPPDAIKALMGVDRTYIEAAFATMDAYPGGIDGYYKEKLGLDATKIAALRAEYLE